MRNFLSRVFTFVKKPYYQKCQSFRARVIKLFHALFPSSTLLIKLDFNAVWLTYNNYLSHHIFIGIFDEAEKSILKKIVRPDWIYCDIGANDGFYTLLFSKLSPNGFVYSFEPSSRELKILNRHISINNCNNVKIFDLALSNEASAVDLYLYDKNTGINTLIPDERFTYSATEIVKTETLDSITAAYNLKKLDFFKIDVEGNELKVFEGASDTIEKFKPMILCEIWEAYQVTWSEAIKKSQVIQFLLKKNYVPFQYTKTNLIPVTGDSFITHNNILFVSSSKKESINYLL
jgi:FkbM family methyltransferase